MTAAVFEHALHKGTLNWDCTIHIISCVILMSTLACRSGDITKDLNDRHAYPSLIWEDVHMMMTEGGTSINDLEAIITLRNEKFDKLNPQQNRNVHLVSLKDRAHNIMCPIKLLLVLALRTGAVAETRIESLLSNVTARASRRVVWKHPKRPVLAKFAVKGSWLLLDEAASNHHMVGVVHTVSRIAGLLRYVHPHDFRRGSARDLSHLPRSALKDANIQAVGRGMGHDVRSGHRTLEYIGDDTNDTWTARVENPYQGKVRAIPLATISYKQPKVSREMCGQWCLEQGLDARLNKNIDKARLAIEKQQWVDWMESELEARDRVQHESLDSSSGPQSNAAAPKNSRKRHIVIDDELKAQAPKDSRKRRVVLDSGDEDEASGAFEGQPPESSSSHAQEGLEMDEHLHLSFDDPQELDADEIAHAETLIDTIGKSKMSLDEGDENVLLEALAHTADVEETSDTISGDSFDTDAVSFVSKYATINVFAFHGKRVTVGDERMKKMSGNGKDEPVQFAYMYKNKGFGCDKNFVTAWELLRHEEICKPSKIQLLNSAPNTVLCEICGSSLSSEKNKKTHVRNMHNWNPRACPYKGCESTQVFTSKKDFKLHKENTHLHQHLECPVTGCKSAADFRLPNYLAKHLRGVHKLDDEDITRLVKMAKEQKEAQST